MKFMHNAARILIVSALIMLAAAVFSCTGNKGKQNGAVNAGNGGAVINVTGTDFSAEEVLTSPLMRNPLREFCYSMTMLQKVNEAGVTVTDEEIQAKIDETKKIIDQRNTTWEHYLASQYQTEEEYWLNTKYSMMFEKLVDTRTVVTEEDKQEIWNTMQSSIIDQYLSENHLPESERTSVEYDKVQSICEDRARQTRKQAALMEVRQEIIQETTMALLCVSDPDKRQQFEDLIVNMARKDQAENFEAHEQPGSAQ